MVIVPEGGRQNLKGMRQNHPVTDLQTARTITPLRLPRASILVHANQLPLLFFHQSIRFKHEGKRPRSAQQPYLDHNLPTSLNLHPLSGRHNPRILAHPT